MVKASEIIIDCPSRLRRVIGQALRLYVDAAYPCGGRECAQVARETLLNSARDVEAAAAAVAVSRRQRALFKAAINYYFDYLEQQAGKPMPAQRVLALEAVRGETVSDARLDAVERQDAG